MSNKAFEEATKRAALLLAKGFLRGTVEYCDSGLLDQAAQEITKLEDKEEDLQRQLAEAKAEIEAMRPMVEACKARYERHHTPAHLSVLDDDRCQCITCQWYLDYLERKQP